MVIHIAFAVVFVLVGLSSRSDPVCDKPDVSHAPGCQQARP
jgi:hypothetical protein